MSIVCADFERSYQVLERVNSKLCSSNAHVDVVNVLSLLGSPLFSHLVDIDLSLTQLANLTHSCPQVTENNNSQLDSKILRSNSSDEEELSKESLEVQIQAAARYKTTQVIELYKAENASLGFGVVGLRSELLGELGIFVQEIQPGSIAAKLVFVLTRTNDNVTVNASNELRSLFN